MPTFHKGTGLMRIVLVPNKLETRIWARVYAPVFVTDPILVTIEMAENERQLGRKKTFGVDITDAWHAWHEVTKFVLEGRIDPSFVSRNGIGQLLKKQNFGMALSIPTDHVTPDGKRRFHYVAFIVERKSPERLFDETCVYFKPAILTQMGDDLTDLVVEQQSPLLGEKHER